MDSELFETFNKVIAALNIIGERLLKVEQAINLLTMKMNVEEIEEEEVYKIPKLPFSNIQHLYNKIGGS